MRSPRLVSAKINGSLGGQARAARLTAEQRSASAERGGNALLARYGHAY